MTEFEEFAYALLDQLSVEINEEKEIVESQTKSSEAFGSQIKFEDIETITERIFLETSDKVTSFTGITVPKSNVEFPDLVEFKRLKGHKVYPTKESSSFVDELFTAVAHEDVEKITKLAQDETLKYLVYSTYAKAYISQISTTYGDFYESVIYLNKFILASYPKIILYKQGKPFDARFDMVNSGYIGALKMTLLEEQVHSLQTNLYNYLQLPEVPDEYPTAKRANLFFTLNPDNFIVRVLGPDVMTFTKVSVDPKILEMIPQLLDIYQRWLGPIQQHHAAFTVMEGMAEFAVRNILKDDKDFQNYLVTFANSDISSYQVRKSIGMDFTEYVFNRLEKDTYKTLIQKPPTTGELKNPEKYLKA